MKKTTLIFLAIFSFIVLSCSNDDKNSSEGVLKLSGKVMSPNDGFPISRADVKVYQGTHLISEVTTDALGTFTVQHLPEGQLNVTLSKGKFKKDIVVNLHADYELLSTERTLDTFPSIAVVTGYYDEIEQILVNIGLVDPITNAPAFDIINGNGSGRMSAAGLQHGGTGTHRDGGSLTSNVAFSFSDLLHDPAILNSYDIIFLNCGGNEEYATDTVAMDNLKAFIQNGGIVYATDWMFKYLQAMFPGGDYMTFSSPEKAGNSMTANVTIPDTDLTTWLEGQGIVLTPSVQINGFLPAWQMVDSFNAANVNSWVVADNVTYNAIDNPNKSLAFTFQYGCGGVFYSSFHTHGNDTSEATVEQMMHYFIFELSSLGGDCGASKVKHARNGK